MTLTSNINQYFIFTVKMWITRWKYSITQILICQIFLTYKKSSGMKKVQGVGKGLGGFGQRMVDYLKLR